MTPPLSGRIAVVTGASRGIGYAAALALARAGAHVVAVARTVGGLEELDDAIRAGGGSATLVPLDLKDHDGIARLEAAKDPASEGLGICVELIEELARTPGVAGAHVMAPGNDEGVPRVLAAARRRLPPARQSDIGAR